MTLQNLLKIGRLKAHEPNAAEVQRLLAAIKRNLADAAVANISDETRFDAAYKAVMQCALVAMLAAGYRPAANEPGHHQTMIQSLPLTLGVSNEVWIVLDALRRQRNANDYTGQPITGATVAECLGQAKALEKALLGHLRAQHPQLLKPAA
jgi:hypothetical protein